MEITDLILEVRDGNLTRRGQITAEDWVSVVLNPVVNGLGVWSLTLPSEHPLVSTLRAPGAGIIATGPQGVIMSGIMTDSENDAEGDDPEGTWTFSGQSDESILDDPLCFPTPAVADPAGQNGEYDVRIGAAETIMHQYVNVNIGSAAPVIRRNPYLSFAADGARGGTQTYSAKWDVLLEALQKIATVGGLGFRVTQQGAALQFGCYVPTDRSNTIVMDIQNRTLDSTKYGFGAPKLTHAIVGGAGDGPYRTIMLRTSADSLAASAAWIRRRERFIDARSADTVAELQSTGDKALIEGGFTLTSVAVTPSDDTTMVFMRDWFLGDKVAVVVGSQKLSAIVTEAVITATKEGITVAARVGDPIGYDFESILTNQVDGIEARIRDIERLVSTDPMLVRTRTGTIVSTYISGPVTVLFDGDVVPTTGLKWVDPYVPKANDSVSAAYSDGTWVITGPIRATNSVPVFVPLPYSAQVLRPWDIAMWGPVAGDIGLGSTTAFHGWKSAAGLVGISGIGAAAANITAGATILVMPVGMRPSTKRIFPFMYNGTRVRLVVEPNGNLWCSQTLNAGNYFSLANVLFHDAASEPTWVTPGAYLNGFTRYSDLTFGPPGYALDSYGYSWYRGVLTPGTTVDGTVMFNTGSTYDATLERHFSAWVETGYGFAGTGKRTGNMKWKGTGASGLISLDGVMHQPNALDSQFAGKGPGSFTYNPFGVIPFLNGWLNYDAANYAPLEFNKRPDGVVVMSGFIRTGTVGQPVFTLPTGFRPRQRLMFERPSNAAVGRLDIATDGSVIMAAGSNTWFSLDGVCFPAWY